MRLSKGLYGARQLGKRPSWHMLGRVVWLVIAALTGVVMVATVPELYRQMQLVCHAPDCADALMMLTPNGASFLEAVGVSIEAYALMQATIYLMTTLLFSSVAALIFLRSQDNIATLLSLALLLIGGQYYFFLEGGVWWFWLQASHNYLLFVTMVLGFYLFPSGRFVPRWTRWMVAALCVTEFFYSYLPDAPFSPHNFSPPFETAVWVGALLLIPISQIYRYIAVSTPTERQQTKWVIVGLVTVAFGILLLLAAKLVLPPHLKVVVQLVIIPFLSICLMAVPVSLAFAIMRYRLWDIDILIRKTVLYGALTGLLGLIYFVTVLFLQSVVVTVTGQESAVATVLSTLLVAALFAPVRSQIQTFIDRRFFRHRYDPQRVLAQFARAARDEVALEALSGDLIQVVRETVQPEGVSLWLKRM